MELDEAMGERLRAAEEALRRLELAGEMMPSLDWFIYGFVRKEAVVSSQIEGTQATLVDLLNFEAEGKGMRRKTPRFARSATISKLSNTPVISLEAPTDCPGRCAC